MTLRTQPLGILPRLLLLAALLALLAAALGALSPARADEHLPEDGQLVITVLDESDNVVAPGSTIEVETRFRYTGDIADTSFRMLDGTYLRVSGGQEWDVGGLANPSRLTAVEDLTTIGADRGDLQLPGGSGQIRQQAYPVAWGDRTMIYHHGDGVGGRYTRGIHFIDTTNPDPATTSGIGRSSINTFNLYTTAIGGEAFTVVNLAVWDETETVAWAFLGNAANASNLGRLEIHKITYSAVGTASWTNPVNLDPPTSEYTNRLATGEAPYYAQGVAISADGSTLAVSAPYMNGVGAVYLYERPTTSGGWGDLTWADGIKVTPVQIPAWGPVAGTSRPFDQTSTTVGPGSTQCDAYCSAVWSNRNSAFGLMVELSGDGSVLIASANAKGYPDNTPGGGFTGGSNKGAVWVFERPAGGWGSAPDATSGKTAIAALANAAAWDPATNYSPGPAKRIEQATAILTPAPWTSHGNGAHFGRPPNISHDGKTITAFANGSNRHYIFERPAGGWADSDSPTAAIASGAGFWGTDLNRDGRYLMAWHPHHNGNRGRLLQFRRSGASWADDGANGDGQVAEGDVWRVTTEPAAMPPRVNHWWGRPLYNAAGTLLSTTRTDHSRTSGIRVHIYIHEPNGNFDFCADDTLTVRPGQSDAQTFEIVDCALAQGNLGRARITIPPGTPDGTKFSISAVGRIQLDSGEIREVTTAAPIDLTVGTVDELASVEFDFYTDTMGTADPDDDVTSPSAVEVGGATTLELKLLNENGKASATGSVASLVIATERGAITGRLGSGSDEICRTPGRSVCEIVNPRATLTSGVSDKIRLTITHPGARNTGTARVEVDLIAADGEQFRPEPLSITFAGAAASLAISEPARRLLAYDTCDAPAAGGAVGCMTAADRDDRDTVTVRLTAADANGNPALVPTNRYGNPKITGPDGKAVASGKIAVAWPPPSSTFVTFTDAKAAEREAGGFAPINSAYTFWSGTRLDGRAEAIYKWRDSQWLRYGTRNVLLPPGIPPPPGGDNFPIERGDMIWVELRAGQSLDATNTDIIIGRSSALPPIEINVNAEQSAQLASGEYTLELGAGDLKATQTFNISRGPAAIALSGLPETINVGDRFTLTAAVTDSEGNPVLDGTAVEWEERALGAGVVLTQLNRQSATVDGAATSSWLVIAPGNTYISAQVASVRDVSTISIAPPPPPPPAEQVTSLTANAFTVWTGATSINVSQLYAALEGVATVHKYFQNGWAHYGERDGLLISGSADYQVNPGDVLWLSSE